MACPGFILVCLGFLVHVPELVCGSFHTLGRPPAAGPLDLPDHPLVSVRMEFHRGQRAWLSECWNSVLGMSILCLPDFAGFSFTVLSPGLLGDLRRVFARVREESGIEKPRISLFGAVRGLFYVIWVGKVVGLTGPEYMPGRPAPGLPTSPPPCRR